VSLTSSYDLPTPFSFLSQGQLQKFEDSAPDSLEFDRLKEHFEPFLRASSVPSSSSSHAHAASSHHIHTNPITAAASSALARDVPGVVKYNPLARSRIGKDKSSNRDEMPEYRSRMEISTAGGMGSGIGDGDVEFLTHLESISEVGTLEQRWANSWTSSLLSR
jgi:dynactin-4